MSTPGEILLADSLLDSVNLVLIPAKRGKQEPYTLRAT
jgi:hypothetical protein